MPNPVLAALAGSMPQGAGAGPLSPAPPEAGTPLTVGAPQQESEEEEANATLGELAMAFKDAQSPSDAAAILLEFLSTAGFKRS